MSPIHRDNFTSPFLICMPFISFLAWLNYIEPLVVSTMVNRNGKSRHPCFVPGLRGESFQSFIIEHHTMLAVGFSKIPIIRLRKFLSVPRLLRVFIRNTCWILTNSSVTVEVVM